MLRPLLFASALFLGSALLPGYGFSVAQAAVPAIEVGSPTALSEDDMAEIVDFVVGNAVFTLYHQAGHMLLDRASERAADQFAALTLLEPRSGAGDQTLIDAIDSWRLSNRQTASTAASGISLPDRHSVDGERASAIVCDMVGADADGFSDIAGAAGLTAAARAACGRNYGEALAGWQKSLDRYRRTAGAEGVALPVVYEAAIESSIAEATILQDNRVLEEVAAKLGETYALPSPPTLVAKRCGEITSFYDAGRNELVLCYELSAYHGQLILQDIAGRN